jgi:hypothetical protein
MGQAGAQVTAHGAGTVYEYFHDATMIREGSACVQLLIKMEWGASGSS